MKKLGVFSLSLLISAITIYMLGSFTTLSFDLSKWEEPLRFMGGIFCLILAVVGAIIAIGDD